MDVNKTFYVFILTLVQRLSAGQDFCGGIYKNKTGIIRPQTVDGKYEQFMNCRWEISVDSDWQIVLTSNFFAVEESSQCLWDYLEVRDSSEGDDAEKHRFCGYKELGMVSSSNALYLYFVSDGYFEDRGFEIEYTAISKASTCSGTITTETNIFSPNYPKNYPPNINCLYHIQAPPPDKKVQIDVEDMKIADSSCLFDRLDVYDGATSYATRLGELCGNTFKGKLASSGRSMLLYFKSDYYEERRGFRARVKFISDDKDTVVSNITEKPLPIQYAETGCKNEIIDGMLNGTVRSPGYPHYYDNNEYCITIIKAPLPDHQIRLNITFLEIEETLDCSFDSLTIHETGAEDSNIIGKLCGFTTGNQVYISSGGSMRIVFKSDDMVTWKGFEAKFQITPADLCYPLCKRDTEVCVHGNSGYNCVTGSPCDINICDHGACVRTEMMYKCYCPDGYSGPFCGVHETMQTNSIFTLSFTKAPESRSVRRGTRLVMECMVNDPNADYTWLFEDLMLQTNTEDHVTVYPGGVLDISNFREDFEGSYKCIASTSSDFAETSFRLNVVEDCKLKVELPPRDTMADVGSMALFSCFVPNANEVIWQANGKNISNQRISTLSNGFYLKIENVQEEDEGQYKCFAESEFGCYVERSARLSVNKADDSASVCSGMFTVENIVPRITSRISGGRAVASGPVPWHVIIREKNKEKTFCGGTLISDNWIVTAAHCIATFPVKFKEPFNPANIELALGTDYCSGQKGIKRQIKQYVMHENFGKRAMYDNDIALIEIDTPINFTKTIQPLCMKQLGVINDIFLNRRFGTKVGRVVGCGQMYENIEKTPEKVHDVFVPYVNRELCARAEIGSGNFTDSMFCAGYNRALLGDACYGDSGGSLTMKGNENDPWVFVGIVSWGVGCDRPGHYGYYTNVGQFYNWIHNKTSDA